ncbi:MAG: ATP-binding protein [Bacteroidales bacterium]
MVEREVQHQIEDQMFPGGEKQPVIVIYGARQVGKTTLSKVIMKKYSDRADYYNCDYLDVQQLFSWERISEIGSVLKNIKLLILDEAQRIKNIGLVLKILVDEYPDVQVIATGSSSFDLSNQINEPLTGRKRIFQLFPFSFGEISSNLNQLEKRRILTDKLRYGMYPGLLELSEKEKEVHLKELCGSYLFKDVFALQQIKKPEAFEKLLRLLAFQIGHEVSYHELSREIGVDQTIVQRYLYLLEESFIILRVNAFSKNLRNEVSKSRKIYFWDLGIRNALIQNHNSLDLRNDAGQLWENFCVIERIKFLRNHQVNKNFFFWRTYQQKEIDYIEEAGGVINAWEFKWSERKKPPVPANFAKAYPEAKYQVISPENFQQVLFSTEN